MLGRELEARIIALVNVVTSLSLHSLICHTKPHPRWRPGSNPTKSMSRNQDQICSLDPGLGVNEAGIIAGTYMYQLVYVTRSAAKLFIPRGQLSGSLVLVNLTFVYPLAPPNLLAHCHN